MITLWQDARYGMRVLRKSPGFTSVIARLSPNATMEQARAEVAVAHSYRMRSMLVISEIALAAVALIGAGIFVRSFENASRTNHGFDPGNVLLSLLLSAIGLYSVMTYAVGQRTHEIGIRMALGARPADAVRMIVRQGMLAGIAGALAALRLVSSMLVDVSAADPATFAAAAVLLGAVALLACYLPARRAAQVNPMVALRDQ